FVTWPRLSRVLDESTRPNARGQSAAPSSNQLDEGAQRETATTARQRRLALLTGGVCGGFGGRVGRGVGRAGFLRGSGVAEQLDFGQLDRRALEGLEDVQAILGVRFRV